jgi:hypothetical protein
MADDLSSHVSEVIVFAMPYTGRLPISSERPSDRPFTSKLVVNRYFMVLTAFSLRLTHRRLAL